MPAPSTTTEFVDLLRRSAIIDQPRLDACLDELRAEGQLPDEPARLVPHLVRKGLLTFFQAGRFLVGRYRGFVIGSYKLLERLGSGGMGSVFLAEHVRTRHAVAIKIMPAAKAQDPALLARFYREAKVIATVNHPNIVRAHDVDRDGDAHFLIMEYVDGTNLADIVRKFGPLAVARACQYVRQAAQGLNHLRGAGLIHRDIKPANLIVSRTGLVKILDLGLARFFVDEEDPLTRQHDNQVVLGTADYLSPEQARDSHDVDIRTDIYSLGATFYFLLTGRPPFADGTLAQKLIWHQSKVPTPIRELRPEVPEGVEAVLSRMMTKDRAGRYQTPAEVVQALAEWTRTYIPPPPVHEMPRLSRAARAVLNLQPAAGSAPVRSQESGVRSQESGVRSQESGITSPGPAARGAEDSDHFACAANGAALSPGSSLEVLVGGGSSPSTVVSKRTKERPRPVLPTTTAGGSANGSAAPPAPAPQSVSTKSRISLGESGTPEAHPPVTPPLLSLARRMSTGALRSALAGRSWLIWLALGVGLLLLASVVLGALLWAAHQSPAPSAAAYRHVAPVDLVALRSVKQVEQAQEIVERVRHDHRQQVVAD
jgi:serine/threonine protein kinase